MKKIKIIILFTILLLPKLVFASNATIAITGVNTAAVGNNIKMYVTLSSSAAIGSWELTLNYDSSFLKLIGSDADNGGTFMANKVAGASGINKKVYTFTFRTLKAGNTLLSIGSSSLYDFDTMGEMTVRTYNKNLKIMTQQEIEASYSKDNYLKSLSVDEFEINPVFNKDTLEYSVEVPENTKTINIKAVANDNRSTIDGLGEKEVVVGNNKLNIVVRAQNGSERIYILNVNVIDKNPIEIIIDNVTYHLVKYKEYLTIPSGFEETTIKMSDIDIPAFYNKKINYTLVGLKDEAGNIYLYKYEKNKYERFLELKLGNLKLTPLSIGNKVLNYEKETIDFDGKIDVYKIDKRFKLINAKNILNGEEGLYLLDIVDKTAVKYDLKDIYTLRKLNKIYLATTIIFLSTTALSIIIMLSFKRKPKIKDKEQKVKEKTKKELPKDEKVVKENKKNK
ncbi:MAG: hypothetical protein GX951_00145 [Mollicutes bacterium]|nr:hypothetical protein [Mollicutes bacterium]